MKSKGNPSLIWLAVCSAVLLCYSVTDALTVDNIKDQYIWDQVRCLQSMAVCICTSLYNSHWIWAELDAIMP